MGKRDDEHAMEHFAAARDMLRFELDRLSNIFSAFLLANTVFIGFLLHATMSGDGFPGDPATATQLANDFISSGGYDGVQGIWTSGMDSQVVDAVKAAGKPFVPIVGADLGAFVAPGGTGSWALDAGVDAALCEAARQTVWRALADRMLWWVAAEPEQPGVLRLVSVPLRDDLLAELIRAG